MASPISRKEEVTAPWLATALGMTGRKIVDVTATDLPVKNGLLSDMIQIEARVEEDAQGKGRDLHLIAKVLPTDTRMRSVVLDMEFFDREVEIYRIFCSTKFKDICRRAGDLTLPIPKSVFAMKDNLADTILMRNLTRYGYKVFNSPDGLENPALKVGLESMAQIHATGFLFLKDMEPDQRREFLPTRLKWEILSKFIHEGCNAIAQKFPKHPVSKMLVEVADEFGRCLDLPRKHPTFETICHGDLWDCNLLYSPDETRAIIIDWQLGERGNPAMDIAFFIILSADTKSLTTETISSFLQSYWKMLTEVLETAGTQVPISFERLEECVNEMWLYGLLGLLVRMKDFLEGEKVSDRKLESVLRFVHDRNLLQDLTLEK